MMKYAREDTHYLLYIYDEIRKELIKMAIDQHIDPREYLKSVLMKSRDLCLVTYQKPRLKNGAYYDLIARNKPIMSPKKLEYLKALLKWRDRVGREEDESLQYILPNNIMFQLIDNQPKSVTSLLDAVKNPSALIRN